MAVVYRHRRMDSYEVFYVGIGLEKTRAYDHRNRNTYWERIVKKHGHLVEIIYDDVSYEEAKEIEMLLISTYGRKDLKSGSLVNLTGGGEGQLNPSEETRYKIGSARRGVKISKEHKELLSDIWKSHSEDSKYKISENHHKSISVIDLETGIEFHSLRYACGCLNLKYTKEVQRLKKGTSKRFAQC